MKFLKKIFTAFFAIFKKKKEPAQENKQGGYGYYPEKPSIKITKQGGGM